MVFVMFRVAGIVHGIRGRVADEEADRGFQWVTTRLRSIWDGTVEGAINLGQLIETVRGVHLSEGAAAKPGT